MSQHCLQMKGEAEAFALEIKAKAESEQMTKKAEAWKEYEEAAKVEMMLEMLPRVSGRLFLLSFEQLCKLSHFIPSKVGNLLQGMRITKNEIAVAIVG
jgi:hypothetical protein